jgi:hypothetical protein
VQWVASVGDYLQFYNFGMTSADFTDNTGTPTAYQVSSCGFGNIGISYPAGTGDVLVTTLIGGYSRTYIPDPNNVGNFLATTAIAPGVAAGALTPSVTVAASSLIGAGSIF